MYQEMQYHSFVPTIHVRAERTEKGMFLLQKIFFGILNAAVPQEVASALVVNKVQIRVTFKCIHWEDSDYDFTGLLIQR